MKKNGY
jgi:hypothetical protein